MEIPEEEGFWPEAIFFKKGSKQQVFYIDEVLKNVEEEDTYDRVIDLIKKTKFDYLAVVFESIVEDENEEEYSVLSVLIGDILDLEYYESDFYTQNGVLKLENFERVDKENYPIEAIAVRRAMTYQNE